MFALEGRHSAQSVGVHRAALCPQKCFLPFRWQVGPVAECQDPSTRGRRPDGGCTLGLSRLIGCLSKGSIVMCRHVEGSYPQSKQTSPAVPLILGHSATNSLRGLGLREAFIGSEVRSSPYGAAPGSDSGQFRLPCPQIYPDPELEVQVLGLPIRCIHSEEGCRWSGPLRHLQVRDCQGCREGLGLLSLGKC